MLDLSTVSCVHNVFTVLFTMLVLLLYTDLQVGLDLERRQRMCLPNKDKLMSCLSALSLHDWRITHRANVEARCMAFQEAE
jgi:hypothetical protein